MAEWKRGYDNDSSEKKEDDEMNKTFPFRPKECSRICVFRVITFVSIRDKMLKTHHFGTNNRVKSTMPRKCRDKIGSERAEEMECVCVRCLFEIGRKANKSTHTGRILANIVYVVEVKKETCHKHRGFFSCFVWQCITLSRTSDDAKKKNKNQINTSKS